MRFSISILFFAAICGAKTKLPTFKEMQSQVDQSKQAIVKNNKPENILSELGKIKKLFDTTIQEYKTVYPQKGPKEELEILTFYYALEPVITLENSKLTAEVCEQKTHEVKLIDGKATDEKASIYAQPALDILTAICPK